MWGRASALQSVLSCFAGLKPCPTGVREWRGGVGVPRSVMTVGIGTPPSDSPRVPIPGHLTGLSIYLALSEQASGNFREHPPVDAVRADRRRQLRLFRMH